MSKSIRRITVLSAAAVAVMALASPAYAFRMIQNTSVGRVSAGAAVACNASGGFTHWTNKNIAWRLNLSGQGSNKATALQNALASWNGPAVEHNLSYAGSTSAGWATDGINTILFARGNGCSGQCLALTALVLQAGQVIVETDVTFSSRYSWNTNGTNVDFEAVAAHEIGHTLGIHHTELTSTPRPTMYAAYFGVDGRSLHADDNAAISCSESRY